jgi:hypothetical protein
MKYIWLLEKNSGVTLVRIGSFRLYLALLENP